MHNKVWLIGMGRSGTTWISENIINYNNKYKLLFEPFHPKKIKEMKELGFHQYIRPNNDDSKFGPLIKKVFKDNLKHKRVNSRNKKDKYNGLLIKDIFANLFSGWVQKHIPDIKIVLLIRNPFAVTASKKRKKGWFWMTEPKNFLKQKALYEDYLKLFKEIIKKENYDYVEKQILIWAIVHYITLKQLKKENSYILFYEHVYNHPKEEITKLFEYLDFDNPEQQAGEAVKNIRKPSQTTTNQSTIAKGQSPLHAWKKELTKKQIRTGHKILKTFKLDDLYQDSLPQNDRL